MSMSTSTSAQMSGNNTRDEAAATTNASTSAGSTAARDPINGQPLATQQLQDRAITILENNQLMMRYAVANNLSAPKVRVYFEKVATGFEPEPVITKWDIFDD